MSFAQVHLRKLCFLHLFCSLFFVGQSIAVAEEGELEQEMNLETAQKLLTSHQWQLELHYADKENEVEKGDIWFAPPKKSKEDKEGGKRGDAGSQELFLELRHWSLELNEGDALELVLEFKEQGMAGEYVNKYQYLGQDKNQQLWFELDFDFLVADMKKQGNHELLQEDSPYLEQMKGLKLCFIPMKKHRSSEAQ